MSGKGAPRGQDFAEAAAWFERAAEGGHIGSQVNLAHMRRRGRGGARDPDAARRWYARAAAAGNEEAAAALADMDGGGDDASGGGIARPAPPPAMEAQGLGGDP